MEALTLADFLLARIAEDEMVAAATGANRTHWHIGHHDLILAVGDDHVADPDDRPVAGHIARHHPARVLAECEAKRLLIQRLSHLAEGRRRPGIIVAQEAYWCTLRTLASVYADHPDYRLEWKP